MNNKLKQSSKKNNNDQNLDYNPAYSDEEKRSISQLPSYSMIWFDKSIRTTKIDYDDNSFYPIVTVYQDSEMKIIGHGSYSPNQKFISVLCEGNFSLESNPRKYTNGTVYLFEDKKRAIWQKDFISPSNVFVNDFGQVLVLDTLITCNDRGAIGRLSLINEDSKENFNYIFRSNVNKVFFSSKRNELICTTHLPDYSIYLFKVSTQTLIHKSKLQGKFKSWFFNNIDLNSLENPLCIWKEDIFETLREKILVEKDIKDLPENRLLTMKDLKFNKYLPDDIDLYDEFDGEYERFKAIYLKPEFKIFDDYRYLEKGEWLNLHYFSYFYKMGVTELNQLISTDINELNEPPLENECCYLGPNKIYNLNDILLKKIGKELKGIKDYIPVSRTVRKKLAQIGINKLRDCLNFSADDLLKINGLGEITLTQINSVLQKYHYQQIEEVEKVIKIGEKLKEKYIKRVEEKNKELYRIEKIHIFELNFENIFYEYKEKNKTSHLDELEKFLTKPDCSNELYSGKIAFSNFENYDMAKKFLEHQIFGYKLMRFAVDELGFDFLFLLLPSKQSGYEYRPEEYWNRFKTELMQTLDSIIEPLKNKGCFGKFNPYAVFLLISVALYFNNKNNTLYSGHLYAKNRDQFSKFRDILHDSKYINIYDFTNFFLDKGNLTSTSNTKSPRGKIKKIKLEKNSIFETINEILNLKINRIIFCNSKNESFFQFAIVDKVKFLFDFPDYPDNKNHKKAESVQQLLLDYSFKLALNDFKLKEKEFCREALGEKILIMANCGSDRSSISELIGVFSKKILGLTNQDLLEVEYVD